MNDPERDPYPSVADHPAEVLFREAAWSGALAVSLLQTGLHTTLEHYVEDGIAEAIGAASLYHEAQRTAGECPECGAIVTDPWGGRHYNTSVGCCIEPPEPDGEVFRGSEAAAYLAEQQHDAQRVK